jgi:signal peptidase I
LERKTTGLPGAAAEVASGAGAVPAGRSAFRARVLSFFIPGLGQLYAGRPLLALAIAGGLDVLNLAATALFARDLPRLWYGWLAWYGVRLVLWAVNWLHAGQAAREAGERFRPRWFNRVLVYCAFAAAALTVDSQMLRLVRTQLAPFYIPSGSMAPALVPGDAVILTKVGRALDYGDIIAFHRAEAPDLDLVKRIVGKPGDVVSWTGHSVSINGVPLARSACPQPRGSLVWRRGLGEDASEGDCALETAPNGKRYQVLVVEDSMGYGSIQVPPGSWFVLGDNRPNSLDSRRFGPVNEAQIVGRAAGIFVSATLKPFTPRWGRFGRLVE